MFSVTFVDGVPKKNQRKSITIFVNQTYYAYFGVTLGNQNKSWASHKVYKICVKCWRQWKTG